MLVNCTPHPVRIYRRDGAAIEATVPPSGQVARIATHETGADYLTAVDDDKPTHVPVRCVQYSHLDGLHDPKPGTWHIVSLTSALAARGTRDDLLVPYGEVRDADGGVIGCRLLARPV